MYGTKNKITEKQAEEKDEEDLIINDDTENV